jgi:hypothetical protein
MRHDRPVSSFSFSSGSFSSGADDDDPSEQSIEAAVRASSTPVNEIPGPVPISAVIGRGDGIALAVSNVQAFSTGLSFTLAIRIQYQRSGLGHRDLYELIDGHHPARQSGDRLLFGVEYADGRIASNVTGVRWPRQDHTERGDGATPQLHSTGGHGGDRSYDQSFWLSPLPPAGRLIVVCAWPVFGVPETRTVLDGAAVTEAARHVVELWPWEPERHEEPEEPDEPDLPEGWFADLRNRDRAEPGAE